MVRYNFPVFWLQINPCTMTSSFWADRRQLLHCNDLFSLSCASSLKQTPRWSQPRWQLPSISHSIQGEDCSPRDCSVLLWGATFIFHPSSRALARAYLDSGIRPWRIPAWGFSHIPDIWAFVPWLVKVRGEVTSVVCICKMAHFHGFKYRVTKISTFLTINIFWTHYCGKDWSQHGMVKESN